MKRMISLLLTAALLGFLLPVAHAAPTGLDLRESTPELEELLEAVALGFGESVDDVSAMTYEGYCAVLTKLVDAVAARDGVSRSDAMAAWRTKYSGIDSNADPLTRINAMYMLYTLAYDVLGEAYRQPNSTRYTASRQSWSALHGRIGDGVWDEIWHDSISELNAALFYDGYGGDAHPEYRVTFDASTFERQSAAYFFSFGRVSVSGWPLFEYDKAGNSMRVTDTLTAREAMLSAVRLYDSVERFDLPFGQDYDLYDGATGFPDSVLTCRSDIITPTLLDRASCMPTPTVEKLPYYTGVHHSWTPSDASRTQSAMRTYAELGFNYVRLDLSCKDFFAIGADVDETSDVPGGVLPAGETAVTKVDTACLTQLDEIIGWGLRYGLHIALQFSDHPGHIQFLLANGESTADTDFYWNAEKQAQTALLWQTIALRYRGVPSSALSFIINHEPFNPGRSTAVTVSHAPVTEEEVAAAVTTVARAVRDADSQRFLYYTGMGGMHIDGFMTDKALREAGKAPLGLAQMFNTLPGEFCAWNMVTDVAYGAGYYPDWPLYAIPSRLTYFSDTSHPLYAQHRPDLTVDGFLPAGTTFSLTMWSDYELVVTEKNENGETVATEKLPSTGGQIETRTFTLPDGVDSVTLSLQNNGCVEFKKFRITLPAEYAQTHYYTDGTGNLLAAGVPNHQSVNDAVLEISLSANSDNVYHHLETAQTLLPGHERCWVLSESADTPDLTITRSADTGVCGYTSNYGYNDATLERSASLFANEQTRWGTAGMSVEFFSAPYNTQSAVASYYDRMLAVYEKYGIGWALYFDHTLYKAIYAGGEVTFADGSGLQMNSFIHDVLENHRGARPCVMVSVPTTDSGCRLRFSVYHSGDTAAQGKVMAASYDSAGQMLSLAAANVSLTPNGSTPVELTLENGGRSIQLFRLDDELAPCAPVQVLRMAGE